MSVQVLQAFFVTVTRKVARPIPTEDAAEILRDLSFWHIHTPNAKDVLGKFDIQRYYQLPFWDAEVIHSAKCLGCQLVWSKDLAGGQKHENMFVTGMGNTFGSNLRIWL